MQSLLIRDVFGLGMALLLTAFSLRAAADTCETLASLELKDTKITAAEMVAAGAFKPAKPFFMPIPAPYAELPAFCRVAGRIAPTPDSNIAFEVWLPRSGLERQARRRRQRRLLR